MAKVDQSTGCEPGAFERETSRRVLTEGARHWLVSHFLATKEIPQDITFFAYPHPFSMDWGSDLLKGKRVRINLIIEEYES